MKRECLPNMNIKDKNITNKKTGSLNKRSGFRRIKRAVVAFVTSISILVSNVFCSYAIGTEVAVGLAGATIPWVTAAAAVFGAVGLIADVVDDGSVNGTPVTKAKNTITDCAEYLKNKFKSAECPIIVSNITANLIKNGNVISAPERFIDNETEADGIHIVPDGWEPPDPGPSETTKTMIGNAITATILKWIESKGLLANSNPKPLPQLSDPVSYEGFQLDTLYSYNDFYFQRGYRVNNREQFLNAVKLIDNNLYENVSNTIGDGFVNDTFTMVIYESGNHYHIRIYIRDGRPNIILRQYNFGDNSGIIAITEKSWTLAADTTLLDFNQIGRWSWYRGYNNTTLEYPNVVAYINPSTEVAQPEGAGTTGFNITEDAKEIYTELKELFGNKFDQLAKALLEANNNTPTVQLPDGFTQPDLNPDASPIFIPCPYAINDIDFSPILKPLNDILLELQQPKEPVIIQDDADPWNYTLNKTVNNYYNTTEQINSRDNTDLDDVEKTPILQYLEAFHNLRDILYHYIPRPIAVVLWDFGLVLVLFYLVRWLINR